MKIIPILKKLEKSFTSYATGHSSALVNVITSFENNEHINQIDSIHSLILNMDNKNSENFLNVDKMISKQSNLIINSVNTTQNKSSLML
jgi:archaellum biogenesis ATPase FlaH